MVTAPDIRGATTIREQLAKHRESATCYDCHQKIDPPGFALENFDPIGGWRTHYPQGKGQGPKVDAAGELAGGETFRDIVEFKGLLLTRTSSVLSASSIGVIASKACSWKRSM